MKDLNDNFTNNLDKEIEILRKKNICNTESLIEKIMNSNLDNIKNFNNKNLDTKNSDIDLKTNSIARRNIKNKDLRDESNLIQISKSKNNRR